MPPFFCMKWKNGQLIANVTKITATETGHKPGNTIRARTDKINRPMIPSPLLKYWALQS